MNAPERFEQLIAFLSSNLPQPVDQLSDGEGAIVFTGGDPGEVVARLSDTTVVISEYAVEWETPSHFAVAPRRIGVIKWRRLPETALMNALGQLIKGAREVRRGRFALCRHCERITPPEWMESGDVCVRCAGPQLGVVH